jgi:hypothetical protein
MKVNVAVAVVLITVLFVVAAGQTRTQTPQGQPGRYQLISAPYKWLATDAANKLVVDDKQQLFRIDTITGETSILQFTPDQKRQMQGVWLPLGK